MTPEEILDFCFPTGLDESLERHMDFWAWMMRGGADGEIMARFSGLTEEAASGALQSWADTPNGRLALILVLDQFSRSVFRGLSTAYAQDAKALVLVQVGLNNGDFDTLTTPWERTMFALPLVHAEGATLRERAALNVTLAEETLALAPESLKDAYQFCLAQSRRHQAVIDEFGRHPHRNAILARNSTAAEHAYLTKGEFPHERQIGAI